MENGIFHRLVSERKKKETENGEENNPFEPTLLPPYLGGKDADDVIYTNTLTLLPSPTLLIFPLLYYKDIIVNLYKLHFSSSPFSLQPNKKNFHLPTFSPLQPNTHEGKPNLFYPPTFPFSLLIFYASSIYTIKPKMYNLMCSLIVLTQHLQLNHSCVFIVVSKVGNKVTIQLASYAKNPIQRLWIILKFSVNTWIEITNLVWNSHQSRLLH